MSGPDRWRQLLPADLWPAIELSILITALWALAGWSLQNLAHWNANWAWLAGLGISAAIGVPLAVLLSRRQRRKPPEDPAS
jgi:hypothetical protein